MRKQKSAERNQVSANRRLPRDQFRALVVGRSMDEVLRALGMPADTQDQEVGQFWYYQNVAPDPVTGKSAAQVQIIFEGGTATTVNFN